MISIIKRTFGSENIFRTGHISFLAGVFFIGSALPISIIFLLFSSILTFYKKKNLFFQDRWNYPFILCSLLMVLSALHNSISNEIFASEGFQISSIWLDTLNWIPLFYLSWGFQPYIESKKQKVLFAKVIIAGSIPILISCALQYWFGVYGPFETLFNSIIWFQKPINDTSGVSGIFSNPNYLGSWIVITLPFIFYLISKKKKYPQRSILFIFLILNIYFLSQTNSRNAILSFSSSLFIVIGFKKSLIITTSIILISFIVFSFTNLLFINNQFLRTLLPLDLIYKSIGHYKLTNFLNFPRVDVWQKGLIFIKERPLFGWGAGTFYLLYISRGGNWNAQHLHNIPLDMAYKYGILVSIILTTSITIVLFQALNNTKSNKNLITIERCWCASAFAILTFQMNDITYFDGKISIIVWILFSGLRVINKKAKSEACNF